MKFLCDRCKTRYSIGDDRVRGKILKIRCKNCANVITVREGMTDVEAGEAGPRRQKTTTQAPIVTSSINAPANGALGSAFAVALTTKPPAALEEEWYVSIDGDQDGPFSLAEAQRWVGSKAFDADLHCWSEGFDDWLPVDKVSHFRGLRKKPAPAPAPQAPPPLPRVGGGGRIGAGTGSSAVEDEPKPLFAATMASLEKSSPSTSHPGLGLPPPSNGPSATPASGMPALHPRTNGASAAAIKVPAPAIARPAARAETAPGLGAEPATQIESPPFDEEASTAAEPVAAAAKRLAAEANDAFAKAAMGHAGPAPKHEAPAPAPRLANAPLTVDNDEDDEDDELQIGEVSRVVNLADLMRPRNTPIATANRTGSVPRMGQTGPVPRMGQTGPVPRMGQTGAVPRMGMTGAVPRIDDPNAPNAGMQPFGDGSADGATPAPVIAHHRRGLIMLIGVALLLLAGVVIAVVLLVFGGDDLTNSTLAGGGTIDTTRPDDPTRKANPLQPGPGSAAPNPFFPTKTPIKRPNPNPTNTTNTNTSPDLPTGSLRSDEIEDMARKYSSSTQRCYMRSQKGADLIMMGDVKKIQATLSIGADGVVKDVTLSQHATTNLGKCLISSIKSWKFRTSPGGLFKISLQFVAG
ncbi:MAG: family finger-like protein [Myxococcales bacterium]|nr:family finger-like protein [Myxococcales bacterium]